VKLKGCANQLPPCLLFDWWAANKEPLFLFFAVGRASHPDLTPPSFHGFRLNHYFHLFIDLTPFPAFILSPSALALAIEKFMPHKMQLPPFLSNDPMQGDPPCDWSDFLSPQLRRFPRAYTKIRLRKALGHGIEGCVARVKFDQDDSRFALKIVCGVNPMQYLMIKTRLTPALVVF
jgi:hypothetical protein